MADWSPEQNMYLSALLNDVTGTQEIVKVRQDFCKIWDCVRSINGKNVYYTGSKAEGLDLPQSDDDFMGDINDPNDIEVSESEQDLLKSTRRNKLLIVTDNVPPAFAMLKCVSIQHPHLLCSAAMMDNEVYLSSQQFMSLLHVGDRKSITFRIQGPSIETWHQYADKSKSGQDNVYSILCKFWPTSAAEWKDRPRHYGWPSQHDQEYIEQFGCHIVPVGHPLSTRKSLEWRLSFSIAERTLVWSFNHTQLQCYAVMKLILKEFIKPKCAEKHNNVLCSYFIKTFLFWQFETTDQSFWQIKNFTGCIMYLFHEFYICIQSGVLRHYFVPRFNLLEIKLTPDAKIEVLHIFGKVINTGIFTIGQCRSFSGVLSKFSEITDRRQCIERTSEIHKRCIWENDRLTMLFISARSLQLLPDSGKTYSYESLFTALVRTASGLLVPSSLSVLLIKYLCLPIAIKKLYNSAHQCNKYVYNNMTPLSNNVYGTDIASSKLWLATFLRQQGDYYKSLQIINRLLSSIPPYAFYESGYMHINDGYKQIYIDKYYQNTDLLNRAKEAWLLNMHITHRQYSFVPRAIQIELDYCDTSVGVKVSPFIYAYYVMFLCYHELGQYYNRDCVALFELALTLTDKERHGAYMHHSLNIVGHCMLMAGYEQTARSLFLESAKFTRSLHLTALDEYNAAYKYLSLL